MRPLSHSSISMYLECPKKYEFKYIQRIPETPKHYFSFGQSVHKALEFFYGVATPPAPGLEEVLAFYEKHWKKEGYKDLEQEAQYFAEGQRILTEFYKKHLPDFKIPFFAEYGFNLKVDAIPVTGKVDRIDKLENGKLAIVDYKTGKAFDLERVKKDPQLTMYQMACGQLLGAEVESLTFYHLPSLTELTVAPHSQAQVTKLRGTIVQVAESIQARHFEPKPEESKCKFCDYKPICPVFKHLYVPKPPEAEEEAKVGEALEAEELSVLVDKYGKLKEQAKSLEEEAERLKERILASLEIKNYVRAFGQHFEVSRSVEEKWEFQDREKVLEILRQHGLYEKILIPSAQAVQRLMKDPALPPAARKKLEALGAKTEQKVLRCRKIDE